MVLSFIVLFQPCLGQAVLYIEANELRDHSKTTADLHLHDLPYMYFSWETPVTCCIRYTECDQAALLVTFQLFPPYNVFRYAPVIQKCH